MLAVPQGARGPHVHPEAFCHRRRDELAIE